MNNEGHSFQEKEPVSVKEAFIITRVSLDDGEIFAFILS